MNINHLVVQTITYICNLSLATGIFLDAMKIAKVIPIYKTGAKDEINNNRPISLLPQFSNILERVFDDRLPILMLLYIMLAYLMLLAALSNAASLHDAFFAIDFCK